MSTKLVTICLAILVFVLVIELIRREKLTFKYAVGWLFVAAMSVFLTVFDQLLFKISFFLGFQLTSNFIFFALLSVFVFLSLLMTVFLCQQNNRNDTMAQKIGTLEYEIKKLKKINAREDGREENAEIK